MTRTTARDFRDFRDFRDYTDTDTLTRGRQAPFEPWEGDSTGLVHVLWSLRNDGLIAEKPGRRAPLLRALYQRLFGDRKHASDDLIGDLRAILDAHDPKVTDGAIGAGFLTWEQEEALAPGEGPRDPGVPCDVAANVLMRSRWHFAREAYAVARALEEAAAVEESEGNPQAAARLRARARERTGKTPV